MLIQTPPITQRYGDMDRIRLSCDLNTLVLIQLCQKTKQAEDLKVPVTLVLFSGAFGWLLEEGDVVVVVLCRVHYLSTASLRGARLRALIG